MTGFAGNLAAHWWIILLIVLLVFGATRLPQLAKGIGQSISILKKEVKTDDKDGSGADVVNSESDSTDSTDSSSSQSRADQK
ncbi:MAG: twin-arginine translocase TatA/TatE family subunit [Agrococcus casei]|uniref:twin-arginine translocase TatA/TatE family subunit n=1 Tax=Agrococcus casei TaxID=343512 RepID=UPI003F916FBE